MSSISKKSVALILFTVIFCGLAGFNVVSADTPSPTPIPSNSAPTAISGLQNISIPNSATQNSSTDSCSTFDIGCWIFQASVTTIETFLFSVLNAVLILLNVVLAFLLGVVGWLFDIVMQFSTVGLHTLFQISSINTVWSLVRDTLNVFFIFMLLYLAIQKIIGIWGVKAPTQIANIILSAIFINFSMFIAKFIIDVGNIFAITFYNLLSAHGGSVSGFLVNIAGTGASVASTSTSAAMNVVTASLTKLTIPGTLNSVIINLMEAFTLGVLIYVFGWAILMFIGRTVMLLYYVITSPIAFVGNTFPRLKKEADEWWNGFVDQILVAPVFLFFIYIIITLTSSTDFQKAITPSSSATLVSGDYKTFFSSYITFIIAIMLILQALKETKKLSGKVAQGVINVGKGAILGGAAIVTGGAALSTGTLGVLSGGVASGVSKITGGRVSNVLGLKTLSQKSLGVAKGIGETGYKLAQGEYEGRPGMLGTLARSARKETLGAVGAVSGGLITEQGIKAELARKANEDTRKERELTEKKAALESTDKAIEKRAQEAAEKETKEKKDNLESENKREKVEKEKAEQWQIDTQHEMANLMNTGQPVPKALKDREKQANDRLSKATAEFADSTKRLQNFYDKMRQNYTNIATALGTSEHEVAKEIGMANRIGPEIKDSQLARLKLGTEIKQGKWNTKSLLTAIGRLSFTKKEQERTAQQLYKGTDEKKS